MNKYIGQLARQEWQKSNRKSWNKSGKHKAQKREQASKRGRRV